MAEVRAFLDEVIKDYPSAEKCLSPTARIARSPIFETAIANIQEGREMN